jgi:hypothetical protein
MSALPPKADIRRRGLDVRFVPQADIFVSGMHRDEIELKIVSCTHISTAPPASAQSLKPPRL